MFYQLNKKGSIGITIIMLVFGLLMSVALSYQKMLQTETLIQNLNDNSDRAMDAAFSGINYAMATIQSHPEFFKKSNGQSTKVFFTEDGSLPTLPANETGIAYKSDWVELNNDMTIYFDENSKDGNENRPPYRFKVGCGEGNYSNIDNKTVYLKSLGEYLKYEGDEVSASSTAQIIAECLINRDTRTIKLKRYRKMIPNESELCEYSTYDEP